ncbi:unnamed protein product [Rotaria magnacalcarata]|uniref:Uncharacterized protein n=1 Tax=Rotaria magnacalcarata TaxID=392030 RepID=A0A819HVR3_9BILA|nr:unnamed protein product [Rotaria magnacalcarata]CAF1678538.1 unnamed protein product [Rotaria magnacalcarata]CAF2079702.1 unnamed protein product [Rotaria magnacalcarata]CAF2136426.1 unnamed protein product [Rotaria magnacalcarata]CAF2148081.1 unnamed protein product [Rotaria magnacalcarata]
METLSIRAQRLSGDSSGFVSNYNLAKKNQYNSETNPTGICNLGIVENQLCELELVKKLQFIQTWKAYYNYYPLPTGELTSRQQLCHLFEDILQVEQPLDPESGSCVNIE